MRIHLSRSRLVRPLVGWSRRGRVRRAWGWTWLALTPGRLVVERWPVRMRIIDLDRRHVDEVRVAVDGVVEVRYVRVGRPWAGLVDQDREVTRHTLYLYLGDDAEAWADRLAR